MRRNLIYKSCVAGLTMQKIALVRPRSRKVTLFYLWSKNNKTNSDLSPYESCPTVYKGYYCIPQTAYGKNATVTCPFYILQERVFSRPKLLFTKNKRVVWKIRSKLMERIMEPDPSKHFWPEHFFHGYHTINDVFDDVSEKYDFKFYFNHVINVKFYLFRIDIQLSHVSMKLKDGLDLIEGLVSTLFWSITKITNNPYLAKMQTVESIHTISDLAEILKEELKK